MRSGGKPPRRASAPVIPIERAFDELRFGDRRTLNLRDGLPTVAQAESRVDLWLRQVQADGGGDALVITGRGLGSLDGVGRVRAAVLQRCTRLKRLNVVVAVREHGPGALVVTVAPLRALVNPPRLRTGGTAPTTPAAPQELAALPDDVRATLREIALLAIDRVGVRQPTEGSIADEMRAQFGALTPALAGAADPVTTLRRVATRLLQELREE